MRTVSWIGDELARMVVVEVLRELGIPAAPGEVNLRDDYVLEAWRGATVRLYMQRRDGRWTLTHPCLRRRPWDHVSAEEVLERAKMGLRGPGHAGGVEVQRPSDRPGAASDSGGGVREDQADGPAPAERGQGRLEGG